VAATSDDDVSKRVKATGDDEILGGGTPAEASLSASDGPAVVEQGEEQTVEQSLGPDVRAIADRVLDQVASPEHVRPVRVSPPARVFSRQHTVVGLAPPPPTQSKLPPSLAEAPKASAGEMPADAEDWSASVRGRPLPLTSTGKAQILGVEDEERLEETLVAGPSGDPQSTSAALAGGQAPRRHEADVGDDSVTHHVPATLHVAPPIGGDARRAGAAHSSKPVPAAGRRSGEDGGTHTLQSALPRLEADDVYSAEESITTHGPAREYSDDSVTTQGRMLRTPRLSRLSDRGEGDEAASVTTQSPGLPANMLLGATHDELEGDLVNETAVMPSAPVKLAGAAPSAEVGYVARAGGSRLSGDGRIDGLADVGHSSGHSSPDSARRIALSGGPSGERASIDALISGSSPPRDNASGAQSGFTDVRVDVRDASSAIVTSAGLHPPHPTHGAPDAAPGIKKPRYGLLVGIVAVMSFAIPLGLFLWLHREAPAVSMRAASEVAPDRVERGDPVRAKAAKPAPSGSAAPSQSNQAGNRGPWIPRRR
jgi:hypothetical protein